MKEHFRDHVDRTSTWPTYLLCTCLLLIAFSAGANASETQRVTVLEEDDAGPREDWSRFDGNPLKTYDFNGDGRLEAIVQNDNHWAYVFDPVEGTLLAELKASVPSGWGARTFNGPEAAVLVPGGNPHLIQASSSATITAWRFDPARSTNDAFHFDKEWEKRVDACHDSPGMDAKVVFADLDGDDTLEILAATEESGIYALRHDGSSLWSRCIGGGNAAPGIGDLDQDGHPDVVHVSDGGTVTVLDGPTGNTRWDFHVDHAFDIGAGSIPVQPAVAQLDGAGGPDIVLGARDSHDAQDWDQNHALILALDSHGRVLWSDQHPDANPLTYTRPIVTDADGDGDVEVYWADWNTMGHKPPWDDDEKWTRTGPANFYRYSEHGRLVWHTSLDTWWSNKDLAIGDVDGDGRQEVLANGPSGSGAEDGIWYLDAVTGEKNEFISLHPWKVKRSPVLADLEGTGTLQWIIQAAGHTAEAGHAVLVYDTHAPYDAVWPHVPYPDEPGGDTQPPNDGDDGDEAPGFSASFSDVRGNAWWIQARVDSSGDDLHQVHVRLDGGDWKPLEDEGWGWGASYSAPAGTLVQLRATGSSGATDLSSCYRWTHATKTDCEGHDGDETFDVRFDLSPNINEWWIETYAKSDDGHITRVDARVDDGAWRALDEKDWGTWARSLHAGEGSIVQLRAESPTGTTDLSSCYRWTDGAETSCATQTFDARFDLSSNVNNWWVEVHVDADDPVETVDAQVDGGAWRSLSKTDWGSWVKSFHVEDGSKVEFRATSTNGKTDLSHGYTWG